MDAEIKRLSARVTELEEEHTKTLGETLDRLGTTDTRLSALESRDGEVGGARRTKSGGTPREGSNDYPTAKVSYCVTL
jgi:hypothetical protein